MQHVQHFIPIILNFYWIPNRCSVAVIIATSQLYISRSLHVITLFIVGEDRCAPYKYQYLCHDLLLVHIGSIACILQYSDSQTVYFRLQPFIIEVFFSIEVTLFPIFFFEYHPVSDHLSDFQIQLYSVIIFEVPKHFWSQFQMYFSWLLIESFQYISRVLYVVSSQGNIPLKTNNSYLVH